MMSPAIRRITDYFCQSSDMLRAAVESPDLLRTVENMVQVLGKSLRAGHKILLAGNGGSAADAQHLAGEFVCRLNYDRAPIAAIALTVDSSVMTAVGNDYGYERIFERQVLGLGSAGDVLIAISTSGKSLNVLRAMEAARYNGLAVIGFTGRSGGEMTKYCDLCLHAPADTTPLVQQFHITVGHVVCELVEEQLFPRA